MKNFRRRLIYFSFISHVKHNAETKSKVDLLLLPSSLPVCMVCLQSVPDLEQPVIC